MRTIFHLLLFGMLLIQAPAFAQLLTHEDSIKDYKGLAVASIMKNKGDSAVYFANLVLHGDAPKAANFFLASNAFHALYKNTGSESAKAMSIQHVTTADTMTRRKEPTNTFYLNAKAYRYEEFKDMPTAFSTFTASLNIRADQKDVYDHLIAYYIEQQDTAHVSFYFEALLKNTTYNREDVLSYIDAMIMQYRPDKALSVIARYSAQYPEDLTIEYERLRATLMLGRNQEAASHCEVIMKKFQENNDAVIAKAKEFSLAEFYHSCGEAYHRLGQLDQMVTYMSKAVQQDTTKDGVYTERYVNALNETPSLFYESYMLNKTVSNKLNQLTTVVNTFEVKVNEIKAILSTFPDRYATDPDLLDSLGTLYTGIGDYFNARNAFTQLMRINPDSPQRIKLAISLYYLKDYDEAIFHARKILDDASKNFDAQFLLLLILTDQAESKPSGCDDLRTELRHVDWSVLSPAQKTKLCAWLSAHPCGIAEANCK